MSKFYLRYLSVFFFYFLCLCGYKPLLLFAADANNTTTAFPVNIDLIILVDDSKSMLTNDPTELRISATKSLIDLTLETSNKINGLNYRIAIAKFGQNAKEIMPLNGLSYKFDRSTIKPNELVKSDFRQALKYALGEFEKKNFELENKMIVTVFTDGRPQLTDTALSKQQLRQYFNDQSFTDIISEFKRTGIELFVIAIGDKKIDKELWSQSVDNKHYLSISETTDLRETFTKILSKPVKYAKQTGKDLSVIVAESNVPDVPDTVSSVSTNLYIPAIILLSAIVCVLLVIILKTKRHKSSKGKEDIESDIISEQKELSELTGKPEWEKDPKIKQQVDTICQNAFSKAKERVKKSTEGLVDDYAIFIKTYLDEILATEDDKWQFINSIVNTDGAFGAFRQRLLANYFLKNRWRKLEDLDTFIENIYQIAKNAQGKSRIFRYLAEESSKMANEISGIIVGVCNAISNVLNSTDDRLKHNLNEMLSENIKAFEAFKVSDDLSEHPVLPQVGVDFYNCLLRLTERMDHTIFPYVKFPELTPQCPESWLEVKERVAKIVEQEPIAKRLKTIDEIKKGLSSVGDPDRLYLSAIADRLYEKITELQGSAESTKLCFFPVPKLTDRECDIKEHTCEFWIQIDNRSDAPGFKIRMKVEDGQGKMIEGTQTWVEMIKKKDIMTAGPVKIPQTEATLRIVATYLDKDNNKYQGHSKTFRIAAPNNRSADDIIEKNPYNEDIPYREGDIFVGRKRDEDNLLKILKANPKGCILYLWGLRRVGKTSLIYHFNDKGEKSSPRYSSIYFPCTLFERNDNSWTNEDFLGIVERRVRLKLIELGHVDNGDIQSCPKGPASYANFFVFINQVRGLLSDMNLILVFDDAEVFGKDVGDKPKEQRLFPGFGKILGEFKNIIGEKSLKCGGIFFMFVGCKDVLGKFLPEAVTSSVSNSIAITLLDMEATREIAKVKLSYDDIAFEYLWRVTGGHPSLTQLICWHVKDTLIKNNRISGNVSLCMVRKAVASLIKNPNAVGYFQYLYRFSIPPKMHNTLYEIVQRVDPETLQFNAAGLDKDDLNHLTYYEILSQSDDKYALRLGFFKLWVDRLGDKDE